MNNKFKYLILFIIWLVLFVILTTLVCLDKVSNFDNTIYNIVFYFNGNKITTTFKIFTAIGGTIAVITLVIGNLIFNKNKKRALVEDFSVLITQGVNFIIKFLVDRPRPSDISLVKTNYTSYPSGHTMTSLVILGLFIYVIYHKKKMSNKKKWIAISSICILQFLIAISRIYLGAHYASDVLGGFLAGNALLVVYIYIFRDKLLDK